MSECAVHTADGLTAHEQFVVNGAVFHVPPPQPAILAAERYVPRPALEGVLMAALSDDHGRPLHVLLLGPPGSGKTTMVEHIAAEMGRPLWAMQAHAQITADDLVSTARVGRSGIEYVLSPIAASCLEGGIAFLDDVCKAASNTRAYSALKPILDGGAVLPTTMGGISVPIRDGFRFVCAANDLAALETEASWFLSTVIVVRVPLPSVEQTIEIVRAHMPDAQRWRKLERGFRSHWEERDPPPSPREAVLSANLAAKLLAHGKTKRQAIELAVSAVSAEYKGHEAP